MCSKVQSYNRPVISVLVMTVVAGGMCVGCAPDYRELRLKGVEQYRSRQHIESMATLRYVLEIEGDDAEANYYMGLNHRALAARKFREGDVPAACRALDNATMYYSHAIKNWPNYMAAVEAKNEALEVRGKYAEALALAQRVADNNRGEAAQHSVFLGNEYLERGDFDNALRRYKIALANDPNSAEAYAAMGRLYLQVQNLALARDSFRRAYELDPARPGVVEALQQLGTGPEIHPAAHAPSP